jgi:hypothetical protein
VDITQIFHELSMIADVAIVVALLPEVLRFANQAPRNALLEGFERIGERSPLWFAEEEVNVFRHDDVSVDAQIEGEPDTLEREFENLLWRVLGEGWMTVVATERDEVTLPGLLVAD